MVHGPRSSIKHRIYQVLPKTNEKSLTRPKWLGQFTKNSILFIAVIVLTVFFFIGPAKTFMSTFSNENNSMRPLPASKGPISSFASDMEASMKSDEEESPNEVVRKLTELWVAVKSVLVFWLAETSFPTTEGANELLSFWIKLYFQPKLPILADVDQELIKEAKISFQVPNPGFIFHNKLPKSGSTTMHNILTVLSQWNNFEHIKIDSAMMSFDDEGKFYFYRNRDLRTAWTRSSKWPVYID